ncbi:hypothetical protein PV10_05592 [Exophiala mesophila]|uniref:dolichyl-phosphate beta-glucosyltransferase n=1 Tax=Exophiala mesophila TaxID=212818 RepID=A0A0D1ZW73_EXOME|nr:uncharacterized protein PV10_05592 [Exophiala mesophila]KIV90998.1 hypothetical protein PV10_05592 [Exophiala mesophila]
MSSFAQAFSGPTRMGGHFVDMFPKGQDITWNLLPYIVIWLIFAVILLIWLFITLFVPDPRKPLPSEKFFTTVEATGNVTDPEPLPSWYDDMVQKAQSARREDKHFDMDAAIEPAEVLVTLVVPAFNEELRLNGMLEEAVNYLETNYGTKATNPSITTVEEKSPISETPPQISTSRARRRKSNGVAGDVPPSAPSAHSATSSSSTSTAQGWEILLVDDGSTDDTILEAQTFSRKHILPKMPRRASGPWTHRSETGVKIPPGSIRFISLEKNRGKGGAVTHGMRHARGQYVVFADADGASDITDLGKLIDSCLDIADERGRGVAVGSRAHLVGSEAVVKRSKLRNFLMHSFHLLLKFMTPPQTARIRDTQCGFKLFSRPTLPYIVPHMHMDGWIFDVEMLMLAEFADIPVAEVAVGWREVAGSKLDVVRDSIGMAWGLALLRVCWGLGIYRR